MQTRNMAIKIRPFTQQREGEEVIIGNVETGVFLALPVEAAELLQELAQGKSVEEVSDLYEQKYGARPDMDDFLGVLETKGIVELSGERREAKGDGGEAKGEWREAEGERSRNPQVLQPRYHFSGFPQHLARLLFSWPILAGCLLVIFEALCAIVVDPSLLPVPQDLFFPDHRTLTWTILIVLDLVAVFIHELGHLVAARAAGVNSRMGISNRLWNLVAETDLTGLWGVPKRQRYLPMLAGMLIDATTAALLVLLLFAQRKDLLVMSGFCVRLIRALALSYLLRILWEFFLFVRTDVYYLIATFFNCKNLLRDTTVVLRNQLARFIRFIRPIEQPAIPASELRVVRAYAVLWLAGRVWAFATLFWLTIPVGARYIRDLAGVFNTGYSANPSNFIDAVALATYFLVPTAAGLVLWARGLLKPERI